MKRSIHIVSPSQGSIGEITNDLIRGLKDDFIVTIEGKTEPEERDVLLCHFINPAVVQTKEFETFSHRVLIQPIDGTVIVDGIVELINRFDLIITPAFAGKEIMIQNGVKSPIVVIPNFWSMPFLMPNPKIKQIPEEKFMFYHESTFHPRKGIEFLYEGFIKAFSDTDFANRVVLVCKDSPYNKTTFDRIEKLKREAMDLQAQYNNPAQIIKISQQLNWGKLQALWSRADAYVSFAKMEGFGIPLLRMAGYNKHILTLDAPCNGYMDFLNKDNSTLVPTTMEVARDEHMNIYTDETQWAVPTMEDVIQGFRTVGEKLVTGAPTGLNSKDMEKYQYLNVLDQYIELFKNL